MENTQNNKEYIETEGKTIKEAIDKALNALCAKKKDVDIKILSEGERGLFEMGGAKPARIRATLKKRTRK